MEQARGRAVRFGQTKSVEIYHFLTAQTFEVDYFEHRSGKILVDGPIVDEAVLRNRRAGEAYGPFASPIASMMFCGDV